MELRICPVATLRKSIQYPKAKRCTIYHDPNLSTRQQSSLKKNWGRSQNSESELWKDPNGSPQITLSLMLKAFKGPKRGQNTQTTSYPTVLLSSASFEWDTFPWCSHGLRTLCSSSHLQHCIGRWVVVS